MPHCWSVQFERHSRGLFGNNVSQNHDFTILYLSGPKEAHGGATTAAAMGPPRGIR
jgi:hypothetical protein